MAWAFATSALLHSYLMLAAMGLGWSLVFGFFFVLQIALMGIERRIGVTRWPTPAARLWTWLAIVLPSPLFSEPLCQAMDDLLGQAPL